MTANDIIIAVFKMLSHLVHGTEKKTAFVDYTKVYRYSEYKFRFPRLSNLLAACRDQCAKLQLPS